MATVSQFEFTGYVHEPKQHSRFPNLYTFKLVGPDGGFIEAQASQTKRDGSPAAVWPLVVDSANNRKTFKFVGNINDKGYNTVTYAFPLEGQGDAQAPLQTPGGAFGAAGTAQPQPVAQPQAQLQVQQPQQQLAQQPVAQQPAAQPLAQQPQQQSAPPMQFAAGVAQQADEFDMTTRSIESSWALNVLVEGGLDPMENEAETEAFAYRLVMLKRRIQKALPSNGTGETPTAAPAPAGQPPAAPSAAVSATEPPPPTDADAPDQAAAPVPAEAEGGF